MEQIETINYKGYEIKIYPEFEMDTMIITDLIREDDLCFIVYDHNQFYIKEKGFEPIEIFEHLEKGYKTYKNHWVFPLYAYIHSGVVLSLGREQYPFTDPWDTSFRGFVLVNRKEVWNKERAFEIAKGKVKIWNDILTGNVYWYDSEAGSCGGFIGDDDYDYMVDQAKKEIDCLIKEKRKEHFQQIKTWIKNSVPLIYRQPAQI
jgi:hypothetical protein